MDANEPDEMQSLIPFDTAQTPESAEKIARDAAIKRYNAQPLSKLIEKAREDFRTYKLHATRAFERAYTLGQRLIVIKEKVDHGKYLDIALSICEAQSRNVPSMFVQLANIAALLPSKDPEGGPWTVNRALTFIRTREQIVAAQHGLPPHDFSDMPDDVPDGAPLKLPNAAMDIEELNKRTIERIKADRTATRNGRLKDAVFKLRRLLDDALDRGDVTAPEACFLMKDEAITLVRKVERLDRRGEAGPDPDSDDTNVIDLHPK